MFDKDDLSLLLLAVVFWGGPRVFESAETACHATEKRLTRIALKGKINGKTNNTLESLGLVLAPAISRGTILENALKEKSSIPTLYYVQSLTGEPIYQEACLVHCHQTSSTRRIFDEKYIELINLMSGKHSCKDILNQ